MSCKCHVFRLSLVAVSVAALISGCGGGGGGAGASGLSAAGAAKGSTDDGSSSGTVAADATGSDAAAKPGKIRRAVRTREDIERERERQVPAPIDRGDGPKRKSSNLQTGRPLHGQVLRRRLTTYCGTPFVLRAAGIIGS